jgi:hypothetical protein
MNCDEVMIIVVLLVLFLLYHNREKFESINKLFIGDQNTAELRSEVLKDYDSRYTIPWTNVVGN